MFSGFRPLQVYKHGVDIPTVFENYEINVCAVVRHKKNGPLHQSCGSFKISYETSKLQQSKHPLEP